MAFELSKYPKTPKPQNPKTPQRARLNLNILDKFGVSLKNFVGWAYISNRLSEIIKIKVSGTTFRTKTNHD